MSSPSAIDNALFLDQQLCFVVYSTSLAMTQIYKPLLAEIGLTYPQYLVMLVLWEKDGINVKELAKRLQQESGSLSPVLKRMQADGLLTRQRDPSDERNLSLALTPKGQALKEKATGVNNTFGAACGLGSDDIAALRSQLAKLRNRLVA
jgi:MarR family transcriptional regulator, organic hydroperoxide resistance regulator